jgi:hypothetical protein
MTDPLLSMADMLALMDLDPYVAMPQSRETFARLKQLRAQATAGNNDALLTEIKRSRQEVTRVFAAGSIVPDTATEKHVAELGDYLLKPESVSLQLAIIRTFSQIPLPETVNWLLKCLIQTHDPSLRAALAYAIRSAAGLTEWQEKVTLLLDELQNDGRYREHLEMGALVTAVCPPDSKLRLDRYLLTDTLINCAPSSNDRMIGILAGLILESCGRNINRAGERLEVYAQMSPEHKITWDALRAEVSGLLTPGELRANLDRTFQQPVKAVHDEINASWQATIQDTRKGLKMRLAISSLVSIGGVLLLGTAVYLVWQKETVAGLISAVLSLTVLLLSFFYSGPIKETRRALTDIGVANAVYAAYMQRMLAISHVFVQQYLVGQKPSFEQVKQTNEMVNDVVQNTVKALREERPSTLDELIDQYS